MDTTNMLVQGTLLRNGTYRVEAPLASGGFGNTYLVVNQAFNERYAMKEFFMRGVNMRGPQQEVTVSVPANHSSFEGQMQKFKKEAQRLRRLHNNHIVGVHDLFEENGTIYYIMDFIDGVSLSAKLKQQGHPMSESEVMRLLPQMLDALEVVHGQEPPLLHLDIKPGNVMVDKNGCLFLIDFGASKQLHDASAGVAETSSALAYTPGYAPMEQVEQAMDKFGPWTDFYALGATLYYMLTMQQPPTFTSLSESDAFRFPAGTSANMQTLIKWLMKPHRKDRPQTVADIKRWLAQAMGPAASSNQAAAGVGGDGDATQLGDATRLGTPRPGAGTTGAGAAGSGKKSKSTLWALLGLLAVGLAVGAYFLFFAESKEMKAAKAALAQYEELVEQTEELIDDADTDNIEALDEAADNIESIAELEEQHASQLPDDYDRADELQDQLNDKKSSIVDQLLQLGDDEPTWRETYEHYERAYRLDSSDRVKEKMDRAAFMINYMYITEVRFGTCDQYSNTVDEPGARLYAGRVKYLRPYIYYRGLKSDETANLKLKYYKPDGTLITGSSSPDGYSVKFDTDVENINYTPAQIEANPLELNGWGDQEGATYSMSGEYTFEVWCDGIFLYRTTVELH